MNAAFAGWQAIPDQLLLVRWERGYAESTPTVGITDDEFEGLYLPVLGPTAYCGLRWMLPRLGSVEAPTTICLDELGQAIGVTRTAVLRRSLHRLVAFHVAVRNGEWFGVPDRVKAKRPRTRLEWEQEAA